MTKQDILKKIANGLIVSSQAEGEEPLNSPQILAALAQAAVNGGAVGIRAERPENIVAIKNAVSAPVIGIYKVKYQDSEVFITPTLREAFDVLAAGAEIIALDATLRERPNHEKLETIIAEIRQRSDVLLMADISTFEEGIAAAEMGFDIIGTTLSGYTNYTAERAQADAPDFELLEKLCLHFGDQIPVIAEGRIRTLEHAVRAFECGAHSVVVGSAITRPHLVTKRITDVIQRFHLAEQATAIGVDIGGTKIAVGLASYQQGLLQKNTITADWKNGTAKVLEDVKTEIRKLMTDSVSSIGIAAAGRVDPQKQIVTDGISLADDYLNYPLVKEIEAEFSKPVLLENDANAAAIAEYSAMSEPRPRKMVFVTIGTGVGGGIVIDGKILQGQGNAGEIGHICVEKDGRKCGCGRRGCLEAYFSRKLIQEETEQLIHTGKLKHSANVDTRVIIELIRNRQPDVFKIWERQLNYFACALESVYHIIEPDVIVIGGEISELGNILVDAIEKRLHRPMKIEISHYRNDGGVIGAARCAMHRLVRNFDIV